MRRTERRILLKYQGDSKVQDFFKLLVLLNNTDGQKKLHVKGKEELPSKL